MSRLRPSTPALSLAALLVSILAVVLAAGGVGVAATERPRPVASQTPRPNGLLLLGPDRRFPARAIPTVDLARNATRLGGSTAEDLQLGCPADTIDLGTWCLQSAVQPVPPEDVGKNDYFYATQKCIDLGGWLPSADELIGAASSVKLSSTLDDNDTTASTDIFSSDGLSDRREMSSTLITTTAGSSAAGSMGSTAGAKGDPGAGEPDPVPLPADPAPDSLQYVTVYDNHEHGGFAGGKPVSSAERFRCAFAKIQGQAQSED